MKVAEQLYQKAKLVSGARQEAKAKAQFDSIVNSATKTAEDGAFELTMESLYPGTSELLEAQGFWVTYKSDYGQPGYYVISWKK